MAQRWVATDFGGLDVFRLVEVEVPPPGPGEVTIEVRAAGMNPADYKHVASGTDRSLLPVPVGYEVSGVLTAIGPDTEIASGGGAVGDAVLAFRVSGGYATALTVPAKDVFALPERLSFAEGANLLLAAATAAEMLQVVDAAAGETVLLHGASGAVGVSVLQQAGLLGIRVVGTASEERLDEVRWFDGIPVRYGAGLTDRVRALAPDGVAAALDAVGTDEAIDVSLELVDDPQRIVSIAAFGRAAAEGYQVIGGAMPASKAYRDAARVRLITLAGTGALVVPIARTFPFDQARRALELLSGGHPGGKLALVP
ncbi:zinc-binding alcohol dehydrogenase family protein [uncultured Friedmanniella sp.]|uniref:quinone oxidoreductase family protein n=1 Tax=uncultured Friedmanniella sp. TaxID=335381 RepID=UPI0035CA4B9F